MRDGVLDLRETRFGVGNLNVDLALLIAYVENYEARMGHGPSAVRVSYRQWATWFRYSPQPRSPAYWGCQ
jgi:hypothetical protein